MKSTNTPNSFYFNHVLSVAIFCFLTTIINAQGGSNPETISIQAITNIQDSTKVPDQTISKNQITKESINSNTQTIKLIQIGTDYQLLLPCSSDKLTIEANGDKQAEAISQLLKSIGLDAKNEKKNILLEPYGNDKKLCDNYYPIKSEGANIKIIFSNPNPSQKRKELNPREIPLKGGFIFRKKILVPCNQDLVIVRKGKELKFTDSANQTLETTKNRHIIAWYENECGNQYNFNKGWHKYRLIATSAIHDECITCDQFKSDTTCWQGSKNCMPSNGPSYANYKLVYDFKCQKFTVWKRDRHRCWKPMRRKIFRPKVNYFMDLELINTEGADSLGIYYQFENLHEEDGAKFQAAISLINSPTPVPPISGELNVATQEEYQTVTCLTITNKIDSIRTIRSQLKDLITKYDGETNYPEKRIQYVWKMQTIISSWFPASGYTIDWTKPLSEELLKTIDSAMTKIEGGARDSCKKTFEEKKEAFIEDLKKIEITYNYIYYSSASAKIAPIQIKNYDKIHFEVRKDNRSISVLDYDFNIRGGWKVDFSTGILLTTLRDYSYFYQQTKTETVSETDSNGTTTTKVKNFGYIKEDRNNPMNWGVAVLAHFYPRTGTIFNSSMSLGFLVQQSNVRVMAGGSILLGREQRTSLSAGLAFGSVKRLSQDLNTNTEYEIKSPSSVTTRDLNQFGLFCSLTYNFKSVRISQ